MNDYENILSALNPYKGTQERINKQQLKTDNR